MTYDAFEKLCVAEWERYRGCPTEVHLDEAGHEELLKSINDRYNHAMVGKLDSVMNPVTCEPVKVIRHNNHVVLKREPQPPSDVYTISV